MDSPLLDVPDVVTERRDIVPISSKVRVLVETGREDSICLFEDTVKCKLNFDVLEKFNFLFFLIMSYFYCWKIGNIFFSLTHTKTLPSIRCISLKIFTCEQFNVSEMRLTRRE